jgi:ABC-type Na+ transport system ATPase subunit NatA
LVLVIGVLGAWGKGKTMTLNMLADLIKQDPVSLGLPSVPLNYMNFK